MAQDINSVTISGRLTKDPDLRYLQSGDAVCTLRLASNSRIKKGEEWTDDPTYIDLSLWGGKAESAGEHLTKGQQVMVQGSLKVREWETREGEKRITPEIKVYTIVYGRQPGDNVQQGSDD